MTYAAALARAKAMADTNGVTYYVVRHIESQLCYPRLGSAGVPGDCELVEKVEPDRP
jgi:hypothetical protein